MRGGHIVTAKGAKSAAIFLFWDWCLIGSVFAILLLFPHVITFLVAIPILASRQHALAVLMHEAYHGNLGSDKMRSTFLGRWFCAFPLAISFDASREYHLLHHKHLNTSLDVYWIATKNRSDWVFPMRPMWFLKISILDWLGANFRSLTGFEALYVAKDFRRPWQGWAFRLGFYIVIFVLAYVVTADGVESLWATALWFVAKYTGLVWLNRLRNISEHFGSTKTDTRNVVAGFFEAFFFIPHDSGLHALHHQFPSLPLADLNETEAPIHNRGFFSSAGVIRSVLRGA